MLEREVVGLHSCTLKSHFS